MSRHRHRGFFIRNAYQRMEREYRLELDRGGFIKALSSLLTVDERNDGYLCLSFNDERLRLTRIFTASPRSADVSAIIFATG